MRLRFCVEGAHNVKVCCTKMCVAHIISVSVCVYVCSYISRCVWLEVIYMVMMSFTSEMHLPQHCQIGLIHTGKAVCVREFSVCECGFAFGSIVWGCDTCIL